MKINETEVLKSFISRSEGGKAVNIFDVIYDAGVRYPELAPCLQMLEEHGEIERIDDETYIFKGDRTRQFASQPPAQEKPVHNSFWEALKSASQNREEESAEKYSPLFGDYDDEDEENEEDEKEEEHYESERGAREYAYRIQALKLCVEQGQASVSFIQRSLPVGYIGACKIVDWMESMGYVSAAMGSRPRRVLLTVEQFKNVYGDPPH